MEDRASQPARRDRVLELAPLLAREAGTVSAATLRGRRAMLEAIRDRLAQVMDGTAGHELGCPCECGAPFDAGKLAGITRELRAVIAELDNFPEEGGGSQLDHITAERARRRGEAEANRQQDAPAPERPDVP